MEQVEPRVQPDRNRSRGMKRRGREKQGVIEDREEKGGRQAAAASHAKQKSLSLRLNMIPHLLSMY